ncbi:hypothetical protein BSKO_01994 [Bryopsis sp. KO-2023]|nr:hypothetical protein BSKO_01994 [Bryopsis sp. KO-2023]
MAQPQSTERVLSRQMCALFQKGSCETCILTIMVVAQMTSLRIRCVEREGNLNNGTDGSPTLSAPARAVPNQRPPRVDPPAIDELYTTESAFENQPASELAAPQPESGPDIDTGRITGKPEGGMPFDPGLEEGEFFYEWGGPPLGEFPYFLNGEIPQPAPAMEPDVEQPREIRYNMFEDLEEKVIQQGVGGGEVSPDTEDRVPDGTRNTPESTEIDELLKEGELELIPQMEAEGGAPAPELDIDKEWKDTTGYGARGEGFTLISRDSTQTAESADLEEAFDSMPWDMQPEAERDYSSEVEVEGVLGSKSLPVPDAGGATIVFRDEVEGGARIEPQKPISDSNDKNPLWLIPVTAVGSSIILFCIVCLCLVCEKNHSSRQARKTSSLTTSTTEIDNIPETPQVLPPPSGYRGLPDTTTILRTELLYRAARYGFSGTLPESPLPRMRPMSV